MEAEKIMSKQKMTDADRQSIEAFRQSKYEKFDNDDTLTDEEKSEMKAKLDDMIQETINERYETDESDNVDTTEADTTEGEEDPQIGERELDPASQGKADDEEIDDDDDLVL